MDRIQELEDELMEILMTYRKQFKCSNIQYKDSGKEIYTIEIPISATKNVPSNWVQMAANKTYKRYYSDEVRALARSMAEAKEIHKTLEEDLKIDYVKNLMRIIIQFGYQPYRPSLT